MVQLSGCFGQAAGVVMVDQTWAGGPGAAAADTEGPAYTTITHHYCLVILDGILDVTVSCFIRVVH